MEEHPYQQYFQVLPCYLTVQDREFRIIDANLRFQNDFGEVAGRYCYQVYKHRSERCEECPVDRTFRDGRRHGSEETVKTLDGREISVIVYTTPVRNREGEITAVMEMSTDITEIKLLQKRLRESQERYQLLFDQVPCYISIQDRELNIIEANRLFKENFGDLLGCKCYEVYKHRTEECSPCAVQDTFDDGEVHHSEEVVTTRDGRQVNTLIYTAPLRDASGRIQSVMEMSTDITRIRELQSQLASLGMLISSVSHGVKGLLNSLDGGVYLVNSGMKKNDQQRISQGWEMVQRNLGKIKSLIFDILYYAKERELEWEPLSAREVAEEVCGFMEDKARQQGVEIKREFDPAAGEFEADAQAIRSLLVNLVENCLDACRVDDRKDSHQVRFACAGDEQSVTFQVADNGLGMDRETRDKAFSLFYSTKGAQGTGLGLFIAKQIVARHGGQIQLESDYGMGTCFTIRLPRKAPAEVGLNSRAELEEPGLS